MHLKTIHFFCLLQRIDNTTQQDSFFTILEDLHPNKNYCIAVQVSNGFKPQCTSTIPKCVMLDSNNGQGTMNYETRKWNESEPVLFCD